MIFDLTGPFTLLREVSIDRLRMVQHATFCNRGCFLHRTPDLVPLGHVFALQTNRIHYHIAEGTRESHMSVQDLQSRTMLTDSWILQIVDTRMRFPCPFRNVVIDYFSPTPFIYKKKPNGNVI